MLAHPSSGHLAVQAREIVLRSSSIRDHILVLDIVRLLYFEATCQLPSHLRSTDDHVRMLTQCPWDHEVFLLALIVEGRPRLSGLLLDWMGVENSLVGHYIIMNVP